MNYFIAIVIVILIFVGLCFAMYYGDQYSCKNQAEAMNVEWKYELKFGCMIKWHEQWVPIKALRAI